MATATIEIDQALLQILQAEANTQGMSIDALLRKFAEHGNGIENHLPNVQSNGVAAQASDEQEAIGERLERKGLIGMIDSSKPSLDKDAQSRHTEIGTYLLKKHEDETRRFFALEEIAEKQGVTPQEWVRQNCPNGKDSQGRSLSQILDSFSATEAAK